jgi:hypothetical protein
VSTAATTHDTQPKPHLQDTFDSKQKTQIEERLISFFFAGDPRAASLLAGLASAV